MKRFKVILVSVLLGFLIINCSLFDDYDDFIPPEWIQGTWADTLDVTIYTFSDYDITQTISSNTIIFSDTYRRSLISQTSTDSLYFFSINESGSTVTYHFEKTTDTTLDYYTATGSTMIPAVELIIR